MFSGEHSGASTVGVGIFFHLEADGHVYVKTIVGGGSADRDGSVQVGDIIVKVDGRDVDGEQMPVVRDLILGPQGTYVVLTFSRPSPDGHDLQYMNVKLMRGTAEYFNSLDASLRVQEETESLKSQLREAHANEAKEREEMERLKKHLIAEREASQRREREFEAQRQEFDEEIARLQDQLRKHETARRGAEIKLNPIRQREEELSDELSRAREKDSLRKEYIEEMRRRHEQNKARLSSLVGKEQANRREDQVARVTAENHLQKARADHEKVREYERRRSQMDKEDAAAFEQDKARLSELLAQQEAVRQGMRDLDSRFTRFQRDYAAHRKADMPPKVAPIPAIPQSGATRLSLQPSAVPASHAVSQAPQPQTVQMPALMSSNTPTQQPVHHYPAPQPTPSPHDSSSFSKSLVASPDQSKSMARSTVSPSGEQPQHAVMNGTGDVASEGDEDEDDGLEDENLFMA